MIKVCMVLHQSYYRDSRVRRYTDALAAAGGEVDVFCLHEPDSPAYAAQDGVRIIQLPLSHQTGGMARSLLEYALGTLAFSAWVLLYHLRRRYDVIHVHNVPDFLVLSALLPRLLGARVILDIHDPMPEFFLSRYGASDTGLPVRMLRMEERLSARLAHAIITANSTFRDNLVARGIPPRKVFVVNNAPDPRLFDPAEHPRPLRNPDDPFTLIYAGTIAARYGLDVAIRALPQLLTALPQVRLKIIGSGQQDYRAQLSTLADRLGVAHAVQISPPVPVSQVPAHLAQADIGIYPALPDPHMNIAVPSKVLEYAVMGLPIVASRLKVLEGLFPEPALLFFTPGDVTEFARCILELYRDPDRRQTLAHNAEELIMERRPWRHELQAYFDLLNRWLPAAEQLSAERRTR